MRAQLFSAPLYRTIFPAILLLLLFLLFIPSPPSRADDILPKPVPPDRYNKMAAHSPFTPPTAPTTAQPIQAAPPAPSWLDKLSVNMLMQDHGVFYVTAVDSDNPAAHIYLSSDKEDPESHLAIASVKWNPENRDETPVITLRRGKDFGQVRYEASASSGPGMNIQPRPGAAGAPPNAFRAPQSAPAIPGQINPPPLNAANPGLRRTPIRAVPQAPAPGGRPVVLPNNPAVRPVTPQIKTDDDDDDD